MLSVLCYRKAVLIREAPRALIFVMLALCVGGACASVGSTDADAGAARDPGVQVDGGLQLTDAGPAAEPRPVLVGHVENARDLGGIRLGAGKRVREGVLFRGPPLARLLEDGCASFAMLGVSTVIDLRIEAESSLLPDDACVVQGSQLVAAPLPVPYNVSPDDYIADLDASESIAQVFEVLGDQQRYPVYFHCTWGRDRTGVLAAVILLALGAAPQVIMDDYLLSLDTVGAYPMSLMAAMQEIAARGGVEAYLAAAGVTEQQLDVLRAQAIESAR